MKTFKEITKNKTYRIINEEFDARIGGAVMSYIMEKGWDNLKEITEEDIHNVKGNGLMTDNFAQALVRTAVRIVKECDMFADVFPYITYLDINGTPEEEEWTYIIEGMKLDMNDMYEINREYEALCTAEYIMDNYDVDYEEARELGFEVRDKMNDYDDDLENRIVTEIMKERNDDNE